LIPGRFKSCEKEDERHAKSVRLSFTGLAEISAPCLYPTPGTRAVGATKIAALREQETAPAGHDIEVAT